MNSKVITLNLLFLFFCSSVLAQSGCPLPQDITYASGQWKLERSAANWQMPRNPALTKDEANLTFEYASRFQDEQTCVYRVDSTEEVRLTKMVEGIPKSGHWKTAGATPIPLSVKPQGQIVYKCGGIFTPASPEECY